MRKLLPPLRRAYLPVCLAALPLLAAAHFPTPPPTAIAAHPAGPISGRITDEKGAGCPA